MTSGHDIDEPSFEEFEEDFDTDIDPGIDAGMDDELVEIEEERFSKSKDRYSDADVANAVRANPKRQQARKRARRAVEEQLGVENLDTEAGQLDAWTRLIELSDASLAKEYSPRAELGENDLVKHKTFGLGFVIGLLTPTKVEVLFESGIKKLVCNR